MLGSLLAYGVSFIKSDVLHVYQVGRPFVLFSKYDIRLIRSVHCPDSLLDRRTWHGADWAAHLVGDACATRSVCQTLPIQ